MANQIVVATTDGDYEVFGGLIREYWDWLRPRYDVLSGFIDAVGGHQALDAELNALPETYGPPAGKVLLAMREGQISGGIAYRDLHDGVLRDEATVGPRPFPGAGHRAVAVPGTSRHRRRRRVPARALGHRQSERRALTMYESLGFHECMTYHEYPADLMTQLRFLDKPLVQR